MEFDLLQLMPLEKTLQTIPSGLFLVDRQQRIIYWNAEAERITGYRAAEVVGQHCSVLRGIPCGRRCGLYDPELPKPIIGRRCNIRGRDGRHLSLVKNVNYLLDADGQVVGGIESFIDISRQRDLERQLRRSQSHLESQVRQRTAELAGEKVRLHMVLDAMADFAYIAAGDFRVLFMNRAMLEVFGPPGDAPCHQVVFDRPAPCPWCPMEQVLDLQTVREERQLGVNHRTYEVLHTPLRAAGGEVQKMAVFRDVTERKEAEEKLREANRELEAFVATVSHDLRSPLTPIMGYAEFMRDKYREVLDELGLDCLAEIERQGERMLALMEDLLVLARVGKLAAPAEPVATEAVIRKVVGEFAEELIERQVRLTIGSLPPLPVPETMLAPLFSNLLANALRYGLGSDPRVDIEGNSEEGRRRILFRDHGPGIPAEERERIFDPFYRGSTSGETPGTGIGLATVRKIVRLCGGQVRVEETPGGGSTFILDFPIGERTAIKTRK